MSRLIQQKICDEKKWEARRVPKKDMGTKEVGREEDEEEQEDEEDEEEEKEEEEEEEEDSYSESY